MCHSLFICFMTHSYATWLNRTWQVSFICTMTQSWKDTIEARRWLTLKGMKDDGTCKETFVECRAQLLWTHLRAILLRWGCADKPIAVPSENYTICCLFLIAFNDVIKVTSDTPLMDHFVMSEFVSGPPSYCLAKGLRVQLVVREILEYGTFRKGVLTTQPFQSTHEMIPFFRFDYGKLNKIESTQGERLPYVEIKHHRYVYCVCKNRFRRKIKQ